MAWYYGTFICGHKGQVDIIGPHKDREWKAERAFSRLCPECYQEAKKEAQKEADKESATLTKEYELPELTGSEKQVTWANTLRMCFFKDALKTQEQLRETDKPRARFYHTDKEKEVSLTIDDALAMIDLGFRVHTDARFWIDHRFEINPIYTIFYDEFKKLKEEETIPEDVKKEMEKEIESLTSRPESGDKPGVVEIKLEKDIIKLCYVKDRTFIDLVKKHRYSWDGFWSRELSELTGDASDRIGEIGNALLSKGYTVKFPDMVSKEKAVNGTFVPECNRWIKKYSDNKLEVWWYGSSDSLYEAARAIPSARWKDGKMLVSVEFYKELQEFADTLHFKYTKKAVSVVERYKKTESTYSIDNVSVPENIQVSDQELLRKTLEHSGVIEDLRDDIE